MPVEGAPGAPKPRVIGLKKLRKPGCLVWSRPSGDVNNSRTETVVHRKRSTPPTMHVLVRSLVVRGWRRLAPLAIDYLEGVASLMVKAMRIRALEAALRRHGCHITSEDGPHTKWVCPCGEHTANIPRHREISPGVVRDMIRRMVCLPEGWLR